MLTENFSVYSFVQLMVKELFFKKKENKYLTTLKKEQVSFLFDVGEEKLNEMVDLALKSQNITEEQHRALI